jgi:hypothetical protein
MSQPPHEAYPGQPYPGQSPSSGTPYPGGSPSSGASHPGQQQPQYPGSPQPPQTGPAYPGSQGDGYPGQPYGQPGAGPATGFGPPPKKKSSALKIVLIVVAAIVVLCLGGITWAVLSNKDEISNAVNSASITVVEPPTLAGRPKVTDPQFADAMASMKDAMASVPGARESIAGMYGDPKRDSVRVAASSGTNIKPENTLNDLFGALGTGGLTLPDLSSVDPGPLGGAAKCGSTKSSGVTVAVCAWADAGSTGLVYAYFKDVSKLKKEFVQIRGQIEKKS